MRGSDEKNAAPNERRNRHNLERHQRVLHAGSGADSQAIDDRQQSQRKRSDSGGRPWSMRDFQKVTRKGDRDGGHPPRLDHEQQSPAVDESD